MKNVTFMGSLTEMPFWLSLQSTMSISKCNPKQHLSICYIVVKVSYEYELSKNVYKIWFIFIQEYKIDAKNKLITIIQEIMLICFFG